MNDYEVYIGSYREEVKYIREGYKTQQNGYRHIQVRTVGG